jgi:hypothetical protein
MTSYKTATIVNPKVRGWEKGKQKKRAGREEAGACEFVGGGPVTSFNY